MNSSFLILLGPFALLFPILISSSFANRHVSVIAYGTEALSWSSFLLGIVEIFRKTYPETIGNVKFLIPVGTERLMNTFINFDRLSAVMLLLISFIGAIVIRYSRDYLKGESAQGHFLKWLSITIGSALTLVIAGNMFLFLGAWIATNAALHQLLTFYSHRTPSLVAARKKFVFNRFGDLLMIAAMLLIFQKFHTASFSTIFLASSNITSSGSDSLLTLASLLLALGAIIQSAQFPFHTWLPDTMETPTPVSALMHAGIINAGGFLIIRLSPIIIFSPIALTILALVGATTAIFGSVIMLTQTSIKKSLAFSTIAQMGFMLLQCGLGCFSTAILHLVAHSLYKAHAFLASGSVIQQKRSFALFDKEKSKPLLFCLLMLITAMAALGVGCFFKIPLPKEPGSVVLATIFVMALTKLLFNSSHQGNSISLIIRVLGLLGMLSSLYFGLHFLLENFFSPLLPAEPLTHGMSYWFFLLGFIIIFMALLALEISLPRVKNQRWCQVFYIHIYNRFYVNAVINRLLLKLWPIAPCAK
ncbi:MAG: proton-conducting transporter membrane subunit [Chthoniobacterales bacterium]